MPTQGTKKKKRKNRTGGLLLVLLTVIAAAIALIIALHIKDNDEPNTDGFVKEKITETAPLGSFADFNTSTTAASDDVTANEHDTQNMDAATIAPLTTASSATSVSTTAPSTAAGETSTVKETAQTTAASDYAYAYAGFTPKPANMNAKWYLLLVNRDYILPEDYSPELSEAVKGSGVRMDSRVSPYYQQMYDAAKQDGITLTPLSGHRRISTQTTNFENKIKMYENLGYGRAEATRMAAKIILPPGTSEHNAGLAMDIISLDVDFEETKAFAWLQEHAQDYGFILRYPKDKENITQITYEPWHWRYVGKEDAVKIKQSGQCLEEYLGAAH